MDPKSPPQQPGKSQQQAQRYFELMDAQVANATIEDRIAQLRLFLNEKKRDEKQSTENQM